MNYKPLGNTVLVKIDNTVGGKKGNIFIPETAKEISHEATIVALGTGKDVPPELKIGSRVIIQRYTGMDIVIDDEHLRIFPIENILAIIQEK